MPAYLLSCDVLRAKPLHSGDGLRLTNRHGEHIDVVMEHSLDREHLPDGVVAYSNGFEIFLTKDLIGDFVCLESHNCPNRFNVKAPPNCS